MSPVVFFDKLSDTCPPAASITSVARWRDSDGNVPVMILTEKAIIMMIIYIFK